LYWLESGNEYYDYSWSSAHNTNWWKQARQLHSIQTICNPTRILWEDLNISSVQTGGVTNKTF
jgi:hypothetical protein